MALGGFQKSAFQYHGGFQVADDGATATATASATPVVRTGGGGYFKWTSRGLKPWKPSDLSAMRIRRLSELDEPSTVFPEPELPKIVLTNDQIEEINKKVLARYAEVANIVIKKQLEREAMEELVARHRALLDDDDDFFMM